MHACIQRREHARTRRCKHVDAQMHGPRLIALRRKQRLRVEATILAIPAEPHGFARLHVGIVHINESSTSRVDLMPFAGVKDSGIGREGPKYAMQEMTEERLITVAY